MPETNIPKAYDPHEIEQKIYDFWLEKNCFHAEPDKEKEPFIVLMPPPNITGTLHLGHALDSTLQDILVRWKRMQGYNTCWIPGIDHASIATEAKVVKSLAEEGLSKSDVGREGFLAKAWEWKEKYGGAIEEQIKKLGASPDWERKRFTMDEVCSKAVRKAFVQLFDKGLIYKGNRMVNWCPNCNTSISDVEVEHEDVESSLWHIRYEYSDHTGYITVATTRPETMVGDVAVVVNPEDERYRDVIGKTVILPLVNREIPVVADEYADPSFGSGAVKVTPAHDPNDFEIGLRHDLPTISVIDQKGRMTAEAGKYEGMERSEARIAIVEDLKASGALVKVEPYTHSVGHCQRCGTASEPLVSEQWFVKMKPLTKPAVEAVNRGEIRFVPERFAKTYLTWMENIKDWCISRQLWWGHRIPVWYCNECGHVFASIEDPCECEKCKSHDIYQDPDVLDTWFSSGLWPFSTLGWPEKTEELEHWYPTSVLVTGYDIIFFWVSRMIFMGIEFMGEKPFTDVLLHGLIRNADGSKMSRSKGTGVNPLKLIEQYGADTLRFTVVSGNTPGNDIKWNEDKVEASRNFCNKIWNASRFVMMNIEGFDPYSLKEDDLELERDDRWILSRFNRVIGEMDRNLTKYDIGEASRTIYDFIWGEYCDWYIEMVKPRLYGKRSETSKVTAQYVLWKVLDGALKLLHPFMPFITEGIWQALPHKGESIMLASWPTVDAKMLDEDIEAEMELAMEIVRAIRNVRAEFSVVPSRKIDSLVHADRKSAEVIRASSDTIMHMAGLQSMDIMGEDADKPAKAAVAVVAGIEVYMPLAGLIDLDKEIERIRRECEQMKAELEKVEVKLSNESFVSRAPETVVQREKDKAADLKASIEKLDARIRELSC